MIRKYYSILPSEGGKGMSKMNTVYVLYIRKKIHWDEKFAPMRTEVGDSVDVLLRYIEVNYGLLRDELQKDSRDEFPYFTDGGFRYTWITEKAVYEFECYPQTFYRENYGITEQRNIK